MKVTLIAQACPVARSVARTTFAAALVPSTSPENEKSEVVQGVAVIVGGGALLGLLNLCTRTCELHAKSATTSLMLLDARGRRRRVLQRAEQREP